MHNVDPQQVIPLEDKPRPKFDDLPLYDLRFRALLGAKEWSALPAAVQARFSHRLGAGQSANYCGHVVQCRMNVWGRLFSQLCRIIGAPLPLDSSAGTAANVSVTEDGVTGGQTWTRIYARRRGFPQVIQSAKSFSGPTGLEEFIGKGIGVALQVEAGEEGIRFVGDRYFVIVMGCRCAIPRWLSPGRLLVEHRDLGDGCFAFTLELQHRLFGLMMRQQCRFRDMPMACEVTANPLQPNVLL